MPPGFSAPAPPINWQAPWWQPWRALGESVTAQVQAGAPVCEALNACGERLEMRFVPQSAMPEAQAYEAFIFETKTVPTRDNLHDFFNGLAWLHFPRLKARLNALQYAEIAKLGVHRQGGDARGPVRDALTLLDENAAFLCAQRHAPVIAALRQRDWQTVFQTHRALLAAHPPVLFGHALLEKLVRPYAGITAHVFPVQTDAVMTTATGAEASWLMSLESLDQALAAQLQPEALHPKPFVPLPVLGVPLWWPANENADFYTDRTVFRAPRS